MADVRLLARGQKSGIPEYTGQMIKHLLKHDQKNNYYLFYNSFRKKTPLTFESGSWQAVNWGVPNNLLALSGKFFKLPKIDRLIKTDLIYSPHFDLLRHNPKTPRVLTIHDLSFIYHPYFFSRKYRWWHWLQSIKNQAKEAAAIIAISNYTKKTIIEKLAVPPEKIRVIYPGIAKDLIIYGEKIEKQPYILYLGTIEPRKNIKAVIEVFKILKQDAGFKNFKLVIAGHMGWLYHDLQWPKDVVFMGQVSDEERKNLLRRAAALIYPSFFEGFGLPPVEAQACGCPVVASNRTSLSEVLADGAILVDPWDIHGLADALKKAIENHQPLIAAGLKNVQRFSWDRAAAELINLFNDLGIPN